MVGGFEAEQRPLLVLVERRPPRIGLGSAHVGVGVQVGVAAAEAPIAKRRRDVVEPGQHPLVRPLIPEHRCRLAQRVERRIRIGDERRIVDIEAIDQVLDSSHAATVPSGLGPGDQAG